MSLTSAVSSLPPYLKPFALKSMLEKRGFDDITKVFLAPLLPSAAGHKQRSNKRKLYTEGWVEFKNRKVAKICAETLNATIVGGLKSSCESTYSEREPWCWEMNTDRCGLMQGTMMMCGT